MNGNRHSGRTVVITGAARGIGASIGATFRDAGEHVVCLDVATPEAPLDDVDYIVTDVADPDNVERTFASLGPIDVLVNNAGIQGVGSVGDQPIDEWLTVARTNLNAGYLCSREAIRSMPDGGAIVFIASIAALVGLPGRSAYSAAKAGLIALTRVLSVELASRRIRVNAICPGAVRTPLMQRLIDDGSLSPESILRRVPLARFADPSEIASVTRFLSGEDASYITGQALVVDGGWTATIPDY